MKDKKKHIFMLVFVLLFTQAVMCEDYKGSDNVERFLGKWNLYCDGWNHSIEISFNSKTDWNRIKPLTVKYYHTLNCKGNPVWSGLGKVCKLKKISNSHYIEFFSHTTKNNPEVQFFRGYILNRGDSKAMAGFVKNKYGEFSWVATKM